MNKSFDGKIGIITQNTELSELAQKGNAFIMKNRAKNRASNFCNLDLRYAKNGEPYIFLRIGPHVEFLDMNNVLEQVAMLAINYESFGENK